MGSNGKDNSRPDMGTRNHTDFSKNSGVVAEEPNRGMEEAVREAKQDPSAQKEALVYIEKATRVNE